MTCKESRFGGSLCGLGAGVSVKEQGSDAVVRPKQPCVGIASRGRRLSLWECGGAASQWRTGRRTTRRPVNVKTRPKQCVLIQTIRRWHRGPKRRLWVRCAVPNNERRGATSLANNEARLTVGQRRADIVTAPGSSIGSDSEGQRGTLPIIHQVSVHRE